MFLNAFETEFEMVLNLKKMKRKEGRTGPLATLA